MANITTRKDKSGRTKHRVRVRLKGAGVQVATFDRLTDAKKWGQQTEAAIREGRHFKTTEAKKHTLASLIDRYIRDVIPRKPKSQKDQTTQLNWWKHQIGHYLLSDLTPALISENRDKLANEKLVDGKSRSPATVNRYLAALSHAFTIAVKEWGWLEDNPLRKISKLKEARGRTRFLSDGEREALLEACRVSKNKFLYLVVMLALSTGARKNEILSLSWDHVDLDSQFIRLEETKNGEPRVLPLVGKCLELMREHSRVRRIDTNLVFPGLSGKSSVDIRSAWETALKQAKIENFRFHDLRHSAASYLAMSGATLNDIAEVLGHKTLQMVKRYSHVSKPHTAAVVSKMSQKFLGG